MIGFTVYGTPAPQGSKKGFVVNGRAVIVDNNPKPLKTWRDDVKAAALTAMQDQPLMLEGPVAVEIRFYLKRPQAHYGRQGGRPYLKPTAPTFCVSKPDGDKLTRACLDALTSAGVYRDDSQVVEQHFLKLYAEGPNAEMQTTGAVFDVRPLHTDDAPADLSEQAVLL